MRFSYLARRGPNFGAGVYGWLSYLEASPRMQYAFLGCAFAILLCSFLSLWENGAVRIAQMRYDRAQLHYLTVQGQMRELNHVTAVVEQLGQKARAVAEIRGRTVAHVQAIEEVGDRIANHAWLVALHEEAGKLHVRGRARSAADIGEMLGQLQHLHLVKNAELDSLHSLSGEQAGVVEFDVLFEETP